MYLLGLKSRNERQLSVKEYVLCMDKNASLASDGNLKTDFKEFDRQESVFNLYFNRF